MRMGVKWGGVGWGGRPVCSKVIEFEWVKTNQVSSLLVKTFKLVCFSDDKLLT